MNGVDVREFVTPLTTPPRTGAAPDLNLLYALLAAYPRRGWWIDSQNDPESGGVDFGGIVAPSTTAEIEAGADDVHEIGEVFPIAAQALIVAAVNAVPWLLDQIDPARLGLCPSEMVMPDGDGYVYRCAGRLDHKGVMHGARGQNGEPGVAWGDGAAVDNHPGEHLGLRTSKMLAVIRTQRAMIDDMSARLTVVMAMHRNQGGHCLTCGHECDMSCDYGCSRQGVAWPCTEARVLGLESVPDDWTGYTDGMVALAAFLTADPAPAAGAPVDVAGGPVATEPAPATETGS